MPKGKRSPVLLAQQAAGRAAGSRHQRRAQEAAIRKQGKIAGADLIKRMDK